MENFTVNQRVWYKKKEAIITGLVPKEGGITMAEIQITGVGFDYVNTMHLKKRK